MSAQRILDLASTLLDTARRSNWHSSVAGCPSSRLGPKRNDSQLDVSLGHKGTLPTQAHGFAVYTHVFHAVFLGAIEGGLKGAL